MPGRKPTETTLKVRAAIIENALLPKDQQRTLKEISTDLDVPYSTVRAIASRLYSAEGFAGAKIVTKGKDNRTLRRQAPPRREDEEKEAHELLLKVQRGEILDATDRRRALSQVIASGKHSDVVSASKALEEMEKGADATQGLPPPQNDEEEIELLVLILQSAGEEKARAAMRIAYETPAATSPPSEGHEATPAGDSGLGGRLDSELRGEPRGATGDGPDPVPNGGLPRPEGSP